MKLEKWTIEGYKSIESGSFTPSDLTVLIGRNNSGKSSIINSIIDYKNLIDKRGLNDFENKVFGKVVDHEITMRAEFSFSSQEVDNILSGLQNKYGLNSSTVETAKTSDWFSRINHEVTIGGDGISDELVETTLKGETVKLAKQSFVEPTAERLDFDHLPEDIHHDTRNNVNRIGQIIPAPFRNKIKSSLQTWDFIGSFRDPADEMSAQLETDLKPNGQNLVRVLSYLHNNEKWLFSQVEGEYMEIMDSVGGISTPYRDRDKITVRIWEEGYSHGFDLDEISSGSKEILTLLTGIVNSQRDTDLLMIEEPELHLHPAAERQVYDLIERTSGGSGPQVIVATHSDAFVDFTEPKDIVRVEREKKSTISQFEDGELEEFLQSLGYEQSLLLQSEAVVLVEGRSDKRVLNEFIRTATDKDPQHFGIEIIELEGIENMKRDGRSIVKLLDSFDIPYLFLIDSHGAPQDDARGEVFEEVRREEGWWDTEFEWFYAWSGYGIEDYLLKARPIADKLGTIDVEDVQRIIDENDSVENKEGVLEKIHQAALPDVEEDESAFDKDRDGMYIAQEMTEDEIDDKVKDVIDRIVGMTEEG